LGVGALLDDRDLDFEARVRLRRTVTPRKVIEEMVAEGMDEAGASQAMDRLLAKRRDRKQGGLWMLIGGGVMALTGFALGGLIGWVLIIGGLSLVGKGGSDAFSF